jgi:flagellin-like protein
MSDTHLKRRLGLVHVVLYGLGVTVGAGIYALVGGTIAVAGLYAPVAFVIAALVMLLPAACFAELTGRMPFAAAEAHFVREGFGADWLFRVVGLGVAAVGIVSAAAISHGAVLYLSRVIDLPTPVLLAVVIIGCGAAASMNVASSILIAGLLTLVEVAGLLLVIGGGLWAGNDLVGQAAAAVPLTLSGPVWAGILGAGLLAFFAFIGFEDIDSIAEETVNPQRTLTLGIFTTLAITTVLYLGVVLTVLASAPLDEITAHPAPLTLSLTRNTNVPEIVLTVIASLATLNGVIVQILMAARVLFGLSREGHLPKALSTLSERSATPVRATVLAVAVTLTLAVLFPIVELAEWTSGITLFIFTLVCIALARIRARNTPAPAGTFRVYGWVPVVGAVACFGLLVSGLLFQS